MEKTIQENSDFNSTEKVILTLEDIYKTFGGIHALSGVSFNLKDGEIHALVGENGAGKSTLIKIITGAYVPDKGSIKVQGKRFSQLTPELSRNLGISVVYQEFNLLPEFSVAENIFLADQPLNKFGLINIKKRAKDAYELLKILGAEKTIDPNELVKNLTVGEQQIVEITKALAANAKVIIMDEPSAVLPARELDRLFEIIKKLRSEGKGIIYISHRINEVFELADRVTILKDGHSVATKNVADTNTNELVQLMVGRTLTDMYPPQTNTPGEVLLEVKDLCIEGNVFDINFVVREGEVVGLAGLGGSGRTTICRALVGLAEVQSGEIVYLGEPVPRDPGKAAQRGLVLVPEDRKSYGLILNQTMKFNLSLPNLMKFEKFSVLSSKLENAAIEKIIAEIQIRPPNPKLYAENLSGGNQQKVVIGKWLMAKPKLVIFDEPTRGIDVGAKAEIYTQIRQLTNNGVGVIMASSELPELLGMSDRILVLHEGKLMGELSKEEFSEEKILYLATAVNSNEEENVAVN